MNPHEAFTRAQVAANHSGWAVLVLSSAAESIYIPADEYRPENFVGFKPMGKPVEPEVH